MKIIIVGGVEFEGDFKDLVKANIYLRCSDRIFIKMADEEPRCTHLLLCKKSKTRNTLKLWLLVMVLRSTLTQRSRMHNERYPSKLERRLEKRIHALRALPLLPGLHQELRQKSDHKPGLDVPQ